MAERVLTKDLKLITDGHEGRIKTLEGKSGCLDDHLQRHEDVYDSLLKKHDRTLYGEHGDDGLVFDNKMLMRLYKKVDSLTVAVVTAIVLEIVLRLVLK